MGSADLVTVAGSQTSMRGHLAWSQPMEQQSRLAEVPKESRLHRWVAAILPQEHRPGPSANTVQVTGETMLLYDEERCNVSAC